MRNVQRGLGLLDRRLGVEDVGLGHFVGREVGVILVGRDGALLDQLLIPGQIGLRQDRIGLHLPQVGFGLVQGGLALSDGGLVHGLVDVGQHGALLDVRTVIDVQLRDQAGHLGPDVDDFLGLHGPRGLDGGQHVAPFDLGNAEVVRAFIAVDFDVIIGSCPEQTEED